MDAQIMIVLDDQSYWTPYGNRTAASGAFTSAGFVQGQGQGQGTVEASNTQFTSANGRDFNPRSRAGTTVAATFVPNTSAQGRLTYTATAGTTKFMGTTQARAPYSYASAAALTTLLGDWPIHKLGGGEGKAHVGADCSFTWQANGCIAQGTIAPTPAARTSTSSSSAPRRATTLTACSTAWASSCRWPMARCSS